MQYQLVARPTSDHLPTPPMPPPFPLPSPPLPPPSSPRAKSVPIRCSRPVNRAPCLSTVGVEAMFKLKAQQELPDIHVSEGVDVLPDLADEFGAASDLGEFFDALFPRETDAGPDTRLGAAFHAVELLTVCHRGRHFAGRRGRGRLVAARAVNAMLARRVGHHADVLNPMAGGVAKKS